MRWLLFVLLTVITLAAFAQKRIDLEDVEIKGELRNDDRLVMIARERNDLKNHVKFRTNFRREMVEELPVPSRTVPIEK